MHLRVGLRRREMEGINFCCIRVAATVIPTRHGVFRAFAYQSSSGAEHVALVMGDVVSSFSPLVRIHSECVTGESFGSLRCDCGPQLDRALALISDQRCGAVIYLRGHERPGYWFSGQAAGVRPSGCGLGHGGGQRRARVAG
ncbi:MAG: hypothetical protein ACRD3Q_11005 [Terriglobales bacterium]